MPGDFDHIPPKLLLDDPLRPLPVVELPKLPLRPLLKPAKLLLRPRLLEPLRLPLLFVNPFKAAELPKLLPLEPLVDVALEPVIEFPVEPTTGVLGATGAVLGAVLPVKVLGGLPSPRGIGLAGPTRPMNFHFWVSSYRSQRSIIVCETPSDESASFLTCIELQGRFTTAGSLPYWQLTHSSRLWPSALQIRAPDRP